MNLIFRGNFSEPTLLEAGVHRSGGVFIHPNVKVDRKSFLMGKFGTNKVYIWIIMRFDLDGLILRIGVSGLVSVG